MTFAAITTLPKTTHNTSTLNTGETSSNYSVKLSLCPHKSSYGTFLDSLTVDLFKIPDVNQRWKRRHTAPTFQTIFELFWKNSSCVSERMYLWALYVRMFVARANKVEGTISWCLGTNEILHLFKHDIAKGRTRALRPPSWFFTIFSSFITATGV